MATATRTTEPVEKTVTVDEPRVTLTLTEAEASTIVDICHRIGGSMTNSRRRYTESIAFALREADVKRVIPSGFRGDVGPGKQSIYFEDSDY